MSKGSHRRRYSEDNDKAYKESKFWVKEKRDTCMHGIYIQIQCIECDTERLRYKRAYDELMHSEEEAR
jgi:hypothetical protein